MKHQLSRLLVWALNHLGSDYCHNPGPVFHFNAYQREMHRTYHAGRHAGHALGLAGEAGEVCDMVKKALYHQVPYNLEDMKKELGDCLWYLTALASDHGFKLSDVAQANVEKLRKRYPNGFQKGGGVR